jgi:signal peptidase II
MKKFLTKGQLSALIVIAVLVIDQIIKIWVKTNMFWHESIKITDWFYIYFTENNGMAFGMEIFNKFFLTGFRIIAAIAITYLLIQYVKKNYKTGFLVCVSLILAGAVGNIIDCVLYGEIFSESTHSTLATLVPFGEGYSEWFYGKVVDMFYFPLIETNWPEWMPFVGGEHFIFFSPIFNFADAAISCGIIALILFYGKYLNDIMESPKKGEKEENKKQ